MSFDAGAITGSLGLDLSGFADGILQAQTISQVFPQIVTEFMEEPLLALIQIAKEAGDAVKEMLYGISESQHGVAQTAEALGVSIEFLDGWRKSAETVGVQADEVNQALTFMSRSIAAAAKDAADPAAQAYAKLGISVMDTAGHLKPVEQLAREVADAMHNMAGGAERTAIAMELFGRGGAGAISFFAQGSKAIDDYTEKLREEGDLTTETSAKSAAAWTRATVELGHAWDGIKEEFTEPIRDVVTPMIQSIVAALRRHAPEIKEIVRDIAWFVEEVLKGLWEVLKLVGHAIEGIVSVGHSLGLIDAVPNGDIGGDVSASAFGGPAGERPVAHAINSLIDQVVTPPSRSQDNSSQGNSNYRQAADDGEGDGSAGADWAGDPAHTGFGDDWVRNRPYALGANQSAGVHIDSIQINAAGIDKNKIGEAVGKSVQDKIDSFTARADAFSNIRRQVRGRAD